MQQLEFVEAHENYGKSLRTYSFYKVGNRTLGNDLVQEAFTKAWSYLASGGKVDTMRAFLRHILNNLIIDEYRKRKHVTVSLDVLLENGFEPEAPASDPFTGSIDAEEAVGLVSQLPARYKEAVLMRYLQELSFQEMSRLTKETRNVMAVRVHRGIKKLKDIYNARFLFGKNVSY